MTQQVNTPYYLTTLRNEFVKRQRTNRSYSLRAYAKHLGILAPTLSGILAGKRPLPASMGPKVAERLGFSPAEHKRFITSIAMRKAEPEALQAALTSDQAKVLNDEAHFKLIAEWEHYAILTLAETVDFRATADWIARRLNITPIRAQMSLDLLKAAGLISVEITGKCRIHQSNVRTSEDVLSAALRKSHREALEMGVEKLESVGVNDRDYSSSTIAVSPDRLPEAKKLIRTFRKQLSELLTEGRKTEVYQLCVQLYPLSELSKKEI